MSLFTDFWTAYNAEDTLLPLYLPLTVWVSTFVYAKVTGKSFHKWYTIHNFHNIGVILLGQVSIHAANDDVFKERIATLWSTGYFIVDLVDCTSRLDAPYSLHAICCLVLCLANYFTPVCQELRMTSKAALLEISNPFMHLAKKTRQPLHFALFAAVYTACRVVWLPVIMKQLYDADMRLTDPIFIVLTAFYGLNLFWYCKIVRIMVRGNNAPDASSSPNKDEDDDDAKAKKE